MQKKLYKEFSQFNNCAAWNPKTQQNSSPAQAEQRINTAAGVRHFAECELWVISQHKFDDFPPDVMFDLHAEAVKV